MGLLNGYTEPHELADAYYGRLEEERRAMLEDAVCGKCDRYYGAPDEWSKVPHGYCHACGEHVEYGDRVADFGCDDFRPRC